jgi:hypothetical protein
LRRHPVAGCFRFQASHPAWKSVRLKQSIGRVGLST